MGLDFWNDKPKGKTASTPFFWESPKTTASRNKPAASSSKGNFATPTSNRGGRTAATFANKREAVDPMADLYGFADQFGQWSGGSGGSGGSAGNGAAIQALVDSIEKKKASGADRFNTNKARLGEIYGQLKTSLEPNAGLTKERYDSAIAQSGQAGQGIADAAISQQNSQNAQRNEGLASLGVDATIAPSEENSATTEGVSRLAQSNASWGNLQGVLSNAQQSRDKLDVQGAQDAGILAEKELTGNYESYVRQLEDQIAQAWGGYQAPSGGSGGSAPTYSNPMLEQLNQAIFGKMLASNGLGKDPAGTSTAKYAPSAGDYSTMKQQLGSGLNNQGKAYSQPELRSILSPSAYAAYNYRP